MENNNGHASFSIEYFQYDPKNKLGRIKGQVNSFDGMYAEDYNILRYAKLDNKGSTIVDYTDPCFNGVETLGRTYPYPKNRSFELYKHCENIYVNYSPKYTGYYITTKQVGSTNYIATFPQIFDLTWKYY